MFIKSPSVANTTHLTSLLTSLPSLSAPDNGLSVYKGTDNDNSHKRKRSESVDSLHDTKFTQTSSGHSHGRPKISDFNPITKKAIFGAITQHRYSISMVNPFPDHVEETDLYQEAWGIACDDINYDLTPTISKLVNLLMPPSFSVAYNFTSDH